VFCLGAFNFRAYEQIWKREARFDKFFLRAYAWAEIMHSRDEAFAQTLRKVLVDGMAAIDASDRQAFAPLQATCPGCGSENLCESLPIMHEK